MDYSREIRLDLENTTPKKLVESSLSLVNAPSNIQIQDLTENNPTLSVDSSKLNRVFVNIIKNAFDAMQNGGTLTINSQQKNENISIKLHRHRHRNEKRNNGKNLETTFHNQSQRHGFRIANLQTHRGSAWWKNHYRKHRRKRNNYNHHYPNQPKQRR